MHMYWQCRRGMCVRAMWPGCDLTQRIGFDEKSYIALVERAARRSLDRDGEYLVS